ncbi:hypothetical protein DCM91_19785 [Chitinophaga costaii]|nr:hypothetical protein DCM91_19785 [Chitinophaga costaii]
MLLLTISNWRIFTKAGQPGWAVLIPIYSTLVLLKIIGKPAIWLLYLFIPFYNIYIAIVMINLLSKSFGKDSGFTVGLIFLPIIFYPILAFSSNIRYIGPGGQPLENLDTTIGSIGLS